MNEESLFKEEKALQEDTLEKLAMACIRLKSLEERVRLAEENLKVQKEEYEKCSRETIPSMLNSLGLSELRLSTGQKIEVKDKLQASIANKNYLQAYRNMVEAEGGGENALRMIDNLFKSSAVIEDPSDEIFDLLLDKGISYESKKTIHHQTLAKYCRERLEQGKTIPEGISVFQYQETIIK